MSQASDRLSLLGASPVAAGVEQQSLEIALSAVSLTKVTEVGVIDAPEVSALALPLDDGSTLVLLGDPFLSDLRVVCAALEQATRGLVRNRAARWLYAKAADWELPRPPQVRAAGRRLQQSLQVAKTAETGVNGTQPSSRLGSLYEQVLAFVLLHEFAHSELEHPPSSLTSAVGQSDLAQFDDDERLEIEADRWAIKQFATLETDRRLPTNSVACASFAAMLAIGRIEDQLSLRLTRSHPPVKTRLELTGLQDDQYETEARMLAMLDAFEVATDIDSRRLLPHDLRGALDGQIHLAAAACGESSPAFHLVQHSNEISLDKVLSSLRAVALQADLDSLEKSWRQRSRPISFRSVMGTLSSSSFGLTSVAEAAVMTRLVGACLPSERVPNSVELDRFFLGSNR
jgi:hypothetical protein